MLRTRTPKLSEIQRPVRDDVERVVDELRRIVLSDFPAIGEVNDHLLWARGKLFRPTLLLLSHRVSGGADTRAVTLAAIVELVHLATLVHDDAVDHSVLRRGMPTVNALWNHQTAVIMGDYLYSRSISALADIGRVDFIAVLSRAANEMSVGELRQLSSCDALQFSEQDYDRLIASKTASLMSASCEIGAALATESYREPLARFGHALGMAFQIVDDLLDFTESEAVVGKPTGQDLREHKVTLPLIAAMREMAPASRRDVEAFFADPVPTDDGIQQLTKLVRDNGGLEYARNRADEFGRRAAEALLELPDGPATDALQAAVGYVVERRN
ncbi:MAG TPA: polyprenyl synthetase family protein [Longimicrobiales bacterium]|nr:polyprenyl synthetase family protein [Longimicrobiales bacterium]